MNRTAALLAITLVSTLATPLVVQATTPAREPAASAAMVQTAAVEPAKAEPACVRKVKVVYRGYGEGAASSCPVEVQAAR